MINKTETKELRNLINYMKKTETLIYAKRIELQTLNIIFNKHKMRAKELMLKKIKT